MKSRYGIILFCLFLSFSLATVPIDKTSLSQYLEIAKETYPEYKAAQYKLNSIEADLKKIHKAGLPALNLDFRYDRLSYPSSSKSRFIGNSLNDYQAIFSIKQSLFNKDTESDIDIAELNYEAAKKGYQAISAKIEYEISKKYYEALYAQHIKNYKKALLARAEMSYKDARELYRRRKYPKEEELLRLEIQLNNYKAALVDAENKATMAKKDLLSYTELETIELVDISKDSDVKILQTPFIISRNNEYAASLLRAQVKNELVRTQEAEKLPQADLIYTYRYEWDKLPGGDDYSSIGIILNVPIFDWGKTDTTVAELMSDYEEARMLSRLMAKKLLVDYEKTYLQYESAFKIRQLVHENIKKAEKSLQIYEDKYKNSLISSNDLLDAQKLLADTHTQCENIKLEIRISAARLKYLGGQYEY